MYTIDLELLLSNVNLSTQYIISTHMHGEMKKIFSVIKLVVSKKTNYENKLAN